MKVKVLRRARQDLDEIQAWLERELGESADRHLEAILDGLEALERTPLMGPPARDPVLQQRGLRTLVRGRYLIFYRVEATRVLALRVLRQRRSWRRLP
ncbi:MAG: type II toxin-antitoxin system RelE/ParE family toxin [Myxococcales bacterium]|nr:type II toxin-antitoxin system RelE/ParE family toxin [Myxococcales bacterium]